MSEYDDFYSKKDVPELLERLIKARTNSSVIENQSKEWYDALVVHIQNRGLTDDEQELFQRILSSENEPGAMSKETAELMEKPHQTPPRPANEPGRYSALKTITGIISFLGYFVIVCSVIAFLYMLSKGSEMGLMGFGVLITSVVTALPLLAFSNLIHVFIDIEHNTRKTREAISAKNSTV